MNNGNSNLAFDGRSTCTEQTVRRRLKKFWHFTGSLKRVPKAKPMKVDVDAANAAKVKIELIEMQLAKPESVARQHMLELELRQARLALTNALQPLPPAPLKVPKQKPEPTLTLVPTAPKVVAPIIEPQAPVVDAAEIARRLAAPKVADEAETTTPARPSLMQTIAEISEKISLIERKLAATNKDGHREVHRASRQAAQLFHELADLRKQKAQLEAMRPAKPSVPTMKGPTVKPLPDESGNRKLGRKPVKHKGGRLDDANP